MQEFQRLIRDQWIGVRVQCKVLKRFTHIMKHGERIPELKNLNVIHEYLKP